MILRPDQASARTESPRRVLPADAPPGADPRLPELPQSDWIGARLIRRAVTLMFVLVGVLGLAGALALVLVRADLTVSGRGVLEPVRLWPVRSQEPGLVARVLVESGDTVRAGQPLVRLDSLQLAGEIEKLRLQERALEVAYLQARATLPVERRRQESALSLAESRRLKAQADLREQLSQFEIAGSPDSVLKRYVPGTHVAIDRVLSDVEGADADIRSARAQEELTELKRLDFPQRAAEVEQVAAQLRLAEARMRRLVVRAPADGIVKTDRLERLVGAPVAAGDLLMELAEPREWRVDLSVSEQDVHEVHPGDRVNVEIEAFRARGRERLGGRVTSVAAEPAAAQGASPQVAYRVSVRLDEADVERVGRDRLRAGYLVEGKIVTDTGLVAQLLWRYLRRPR
ncbi:MAG: HlyD family efflux transporter periplasmic adaptor subunit [Gemmatimonadetes bacterium]|nr:HlyD family efflux transporter periplasmic adaptor subunit [Gemmatimonadota bacterium]